MREILGEVYLVGCGPGDPELITVKGLRLLKGADTIIHDRLINFRILDFAKPNAELIDVGKSSKSTGYHQDEINQMMVEKAKLGKKVIRLKGGDPFLFGRGGEESEILRKHNVPFQVVPGVTSAIAAPAYAGIPVTHRSIASSVTFVSGNEDINKANSNINWHAISNTGGTIVVLMSRNKLNMITGQLIKVGLNPDTPAALIRWGSEPHQTTITGTITNISLQADVANLLPPVALVIGNVVNLRNKLNWFENLPLFGKRVLVTRTRKQASKLSGLLAQQGAIPIELPAIKIIPINIKALHCQLREINKFSWLVFTSSNAVHIFFEELHNTGFDSRNLSGIKIAAIGAVTKLSLEKYGIKNVVMPKSYNTNSLGDLLIKEVFKDQNILLPRSELGHYEFVAKLKSAGIQVQEINIYKTVIPKHSKKLATKIFKEGIDIATFTSTSTVHGLVDLLGGINQLRNVNIACIGPVTEASIKIAGLTPNIIAPESTVESLVKAIKTHFTR
ncbi:MAG: uroporphyrinogen III methyltransferase / synthase [Chloroflexi bacterium]|nr:MAG: uroporphyrinogen III methyltransferase / synthase [Chloroflexota bacterium]